MRGLAISIIFLSIDRWGALAVWKFRGAEPPLLQVNAGLNLCLARLPSCGRQTLMDVRDVDSGCAHFVSDNCSSELCMNQDLVCFEKGKNVCDAVLEMCGQLANEMAAVAIASSAEASTNLSITSQPGSIMFVHIPKNAGTAIEDAGADIDFWWGRNNRHLWTKAKMPTGDSCNGWHTPPEFLGDSYNPYNDVDTFCVVRDPYDRMVSEFLYLMSVPWGTESTARYMDWRAHNTCTKDNLNYFVQKTLTEVLAGGRYMLDCHVVPQSEYVWGKDGKTWCKNRFTMENVKNGLYKLKSKHASLKSLELHFENGHSSTCNLESNDLDASSRWLVERVYAEDFARLGFEFKA